MYSALARSSKPSSRPEAEFRSKPTVKVLHARQLRSRDRGDRAGIDARRKDRRQRAHRETSCRLTAWRNRRSSIPRRALPETPWPPRGSRNPNRCRGTDSRPGDTTRLVPGGRSFTPANSVRSVKKFWKVRYSTSASPVERRDHAGRSQDRLHFRTEQKARSDLRPVERFHAEAIPGEHKTAFDPIPDRKGEHSVEARQRRKAPFGEGGKQHLGIRARPEATAERLQLRAQLLEIVELAIVDHDKAPVGRRHRLAAGLAQIDDGEATMAESDGAVDPDALPVGATMRDNIGHALHDRRGGGAPDRSKVPAMPHMARQAALPAAGAGLRAITVMPASSTRSRSITRPSPAHQARTSSAD